MSTEILTIFISHISEEKELARILTKHLKEDFAGRLQVFVSSDMESIMSGDDWLDSVKRALDRASLELILCSRVSISRPWVNFEAGAAWLKKIPIVPVCHTSFPACELPIPFSVLH
ncbi:MAG: toll/interleukin-1 receptor domain-containing protein, partial [Acidobacteriota bacterium]|nr:toll/interleukin-1 receptor domain-containing protein [Acidobacteriota bacterium]